MTRESHRPAVAAIFLVAAVSTWWQMVKFPGPGFGRFWETVSIARNLVAGRGFASPFGTLDTGPTAHLAPAFPVMLAGLIRIFGDGPLFALSAMLLCVLAHATYCALFVPLSQRTFGDRGPGMWAGVFSAVVPTIQVLPQWEAIYSAVGSQAFCLASARLVRSGRFAAGLVVGALCGGVLLLNPALIFVAIPWMAYLRPPTRVWAAFAVGTILVCLPWTVRNYREFGAVFYIRDNLGAELNMSNTDCADARHPVNQKNGCHHRWQPNLSVAEATAIRDMGEVAYNRSRMRMAIDWIESHPARFVRLTLRRAWEFWFPWPENPPIYELSRWLITALSIGGLVLLARERNRVTVFYAGAMLVYPLMYYFVQASTRYRSPVLWISALPAAYAAWRLYAHRGGGGHGGNAE